MRTPHCVNVLLTFVNCSIKHLFCTAVGRSGLIIAEVTVPRPSCGVNQVASGTLHVYSY